MTQRLPFVKGHGTENDFVLIPDRDGELALSAAQVAAICDRRAGIGADGILRVVAVAAEPEAAAFRGRADWFMDYRNADGSIAEMCGNGIRVFARYLVDFGLAAPGALEIGTRGGLRTVICPPDGPVTVDMGVASAARGRPDHGPGGRALVERHRGADAEPARGGVRRRPDGGGRPARTTGSWARRGLPGRGERRVRGPAWAGPPRIAGARTRLGRNPLLRDRGVRGRGRRGARRSDVAGQLCGRRARRARWRRPRRGPVRFCWPALRNWWQPGSGGSQTARRSRCSRATLVYGPPAGTD